jgi:pyruvate, water dikinase
VTTQLHIATGVVPLRDATDPGSWGGKAANLAAALRAGLEVPDGVAIAPATVRHIVAGGGLADIATLIQPLGPALAVRSSAIGEDGSIASFAGQYVTQLGVRNAAGSVAAAISAVAESVHHGGVTAYRIHFGLSDAVDMAVLIQRMVQPRAAGVLFTRHPVTGADERVIEAVLGLGEAAVAGVVIPDEYRVTAAGEILTRRAGLKRVALEVSPDGGTNEAEVDFDESTSLCLSDSDLNALNDLASRCVQTFNSDSLDIEWALDASGVHLLQCRPAMTGIPHPRRPVA